MIPHKLFKKHLQNVKFYPRADNFTHALHVMHVTNTMSVIMIIIVIIMITIFIIRSSKFWGCEFVNWVNIMLCVIFGKLYFVSVCSM